LPQLVDAGGGRVVFLGGFDQNVWLADQQLSRHLLELSVFRTQLVDFTKENDRIRIRLKCNVPRKFIYFCGSMCFVLILLIGTILSKGFCPLNRFRCAA
jgi:hypothetical protein